jgi:hypothetical protein
MALILGLTVVVLIIAGFIAYWLFMMMLGLLFVVAVFWYFVFMSIFPDNPMIILPSAIVATGLCIWAAMAWDTSRKKASVKNAD